MTPYPLAADRCAFVLVDVQTKLLDHMHDRDLVLKNLLILIQAMRKLEVPILWFEQVPDKMGPSAESIRALLPDLAPTAKSSFGCFGEPTGDRLLADTGVRHLIVAGIEAHVCVYQTVMDLLSRQRRVSVVADAVSSRSVTNRDLALQRMQAEGAALTTTEMLIFELLGSARHPAFRDVLKLVR